MKSSAPTPYYVAASPLIPGGDDRYLSNQLSAISNSLGSILRMTPQSATAAPKVPQDGMMRLSRDPWWPVAGQTADAWVYYDLAGLVWRYMSTPPTTT